MVAAVAFYLVFAMGLCVFALFPHAGSDGWRRTPAAAALFGFFSYAVYDLTNLATLRDWPLGLSLLDMAWGVVISTVAASAGKMAMESVG